MYLILDTESDVDQDRLLRTYPHGGRFIGSKDHICDQIKQEICRERDPNASPDCFIPARYHSPNTVMGLLVDRQLNYQAHYLLNQQLPDGRPDVKAITTNFWGLVAHAVDNGVCVVDFNGLGFDFPMMEACGLEHGVNMACWFLEDPKFWTDPRGGGALRYHLDLYSYLAGKGRGGGGLDWWAKLVGLPGKIASHGDDVQAMLKHATGLADVADYCTCDVLNTYGLLYRVLFCRGLVTTDWRGPTFERTMTLMATGRGKEVQRFIDLYRAGNPAGSPSV